MRGIKLSIQIKKAVFQVKEIIKEKIFGRCFQIDNIEKVVIGGLDNFFDSGIL